MGWDVDIKQTGRQTYRVEVYESSGIGSGIVFLIIIFIIGGLITLFGGKKEPTVYENQFYTLHAESTFEIREIKDCEDKFGNCYDEALYYQYGYKEGYNASVDLYKLDGAYATLSGTIFVPEDRTDHRLELSGLKVIIYGDGKRLYTSPQMQAESAPVPFLIDVTDVSELSIRYVGGANTWPRPIGIGNITLGTDSSLLKDTVDMPDRLLDCELLESTFACRYPYVTYADHFGNTYNDCMEYTFGLREDCDVYKLDGKYERLTGTVFVPTIRKNSTYNWDYEDMYYVSVYGDGELLFTSPRMVDDIMPVHFEVNVAGVEELKVTYYGGAITWKMEVALADLYLYA